MPEQDRANGGLNPGVPGIRERRRNDRRLDTWKEIGAFFGRDERTVKRWEASRGLPVHRVPGSGRATVYAYTSELERWLQSADAILPAVLPGSESSEDPEMEPVLTGELDPPLPDSAPREENPQKWRQNHPEKSQLSPLRPSRFRP